MGEYIHQLLFGYYPYLVFVVFVVGSMMRYRTQQETWNAGSTQFLSGQKSMRIGNNLFHITIIILFFSHLFGLFTAKSIYSAILSPEKKQWLAMTMGGAIGILCFIGMTILIVRRFTDPRVKAVKSRMDNVVLVLIYVTLITGLFTIPASAEHPKGKGMVALCNWAQHLVTFRDPAGVPGVEDPADFIAHHSLIFKAHIVLGLSIFLLFPFSTLVHVFSVPLGFLFRKNTQIVRKRG